jgi:hypothetical protein
MMPLTMPLRDGTVLTYATSATRLPRERSCATRRSVNVSSLGRQCLQCRAEHGLRPTVEDGDPLLPTFNLYRRRASHEAANRVA